MWDEDSKRVLLGSGKEWGWTDSSRLTCAPRCCDLPRACAPTSVNSDLQTSR